MDAGAQNPTYWRKRLEWHSILSDYLIMKCSRPHERQDWISLQLAKLAAQRIREQPDSISAGRANIHRWINGPNANAHWSAARLEWLALIDQHSSSEIADLLESEGDEGQRLRSSMPFIQPPFFTENERLRILEIAYQE